MVTPNTPPDARMVEKIAEWLMDMYGNPINHGSPDNAREIFADHASRLMALIFTPEVETVLDTIAGTAKRTPGTKEVCELCAVDYGDAMTVAPQGSKFACAQKSCPIRKGN